MVLVLWVRVRVRGMHRGNSLYEYYGSIGLG